MATLGGFRKENPTERLDYRSHEYGSGVVVFALSQLQIRVESDTLERWE